MNKVIIIGGGASGMMASIKLASKGYDVTLLEKNEKLGKKIYITGKGRCNLLNACDKETFFESVSSNSKFLYSAYNSFDFKDAYDFFKNLGLKMKVERGNRVFPISDKASDITKVLQNKLNNLNVDIKLNTNVNNLIIDNNNAIGVIFNNNKKIFADKIVVATGGLSYPTTGSTGDGIKWAKTCGHNIISPIPSLVGLNCSGNYFNEISGLSLKNVSIKVLNNKIIYQDFGEMLFTHHGVSGPIILNATSRVGRELSNKTKIILDFKPNVDEKKLDKRLIKEIEENGNKSFKNNIHLWLPSSLDNEILKRSNIEPTKQLKFLTKQDRKNFISTIKKFEIQVESLRGFNEAIITKGGVDTKEINPKTFESKLISNLYFIGEVLDVDALTGGFNLQIAWSSGNKVIV